MPHTLAYLAMASHAGRPHVLSPDVCEKRYMHGPIPMKVESCRAEMMRVCLSPAQILRQGSMHAIIVGLKTFGRRTHEDEWDEVRATRCFVFVLQIECLKSDRLVIVARRRRAQQGFVCIANRVFEVGPTS